MNVAATTTTMTTTTPASTSKTKNDDKMKTILTTNNDKDSTLNEYPQWHNTVAGGVAGFGSRLCTAPLDLIRIRRQLNPSTLYPRESIWQSWVNIVQNEGGFAGLFRGNMAALGLWMGYAAVQFSVYHRIRSACQESSEASRILVIPASAVPFVAGAVAGICSTSVSYPFDVCRTAFAARGVTSKSSPSLGSMAEPSLRHLTNRPPTSWREFVVQMYRHHGVGGFYAGFGPAVLQIIPYMGLTFGIYDLLTQSHSEKTAVSSAYAGSIAGAVSKLAVYPLDTIKRRLQAQAFYGNESRRPYQGLSDCLGRVVREEGFRALYRGVVPSVMKTTISTALSFGLYRGTKNALEAFHDGGRF